MSSKLPAVNYRQIIKIAKKLGFHFYRQAKGSHEIWRRAIDNRYTTIPHHSKKDLTRRTLKSIIDDFGITTKEFVKLKSGV